MGDPMTERLKREYTKGTRLCIEIIDGERNIPSAEYCTVDHVDDNGNIHCKSDIGRDLELSFSRDRFRKVPQGKITVNNKYPMLVGRSGVGKERIFSIKDAARFIYEYGKRTDRVNITTLTSAKVIRARGQTIAAVYDKEYGDEVAKALLLLKEQELLEDHTKDEVERMTNEEMARVEKIKEMYPKGTRICLEHMEDYYPVEEGTMGTVDHVDDMGSIFMKWDNGRSLAIIPNADKFHITEMPRLFIGHHSDGSEEIRNTYEMAKFIVEKGQTGDLLITDEQGTPFLNTFGTFIDKIADMEYREKLLKELVPMQKELESQVFGGGDEETAEETAEETSEISEQDMSM